MKKFGWLVGLLIFSISWCQADKITIGVASNFVRTLESLAHEFKLQTGHEVVIISASTGQLYAQINQSAPIDVFMAADTKRPQLLVEAGLASDFHVYASGLLVLVINKDSAGDCHNSLNHSSIKYLAIANPDLAPYGQAAKQYLLYEKLWDAMQSKLVMGENIAQTAQMVISRNANAGILAQSLWSDQWQENQCVWPLPTHTYDPIDQAMVFIKSSKKRAVFESFTEFMATEQSQALIVSSGYHSKNHD